MKEIFELDKSDLDFGIYRVMNLRKARIEEFLEQQLPQIVQETLAPFAQDGKEKLRARMAKMEKDAAEMGMTMDQLPETAPVRKEYIMHIADCLEMCGMNIATDFLPKALPLNTPRRLSRR